MGRRTVIMCDCEECGWMGLDSELSPSGWCPRCLSPKIKRTSKDVWVSGL